MIEGQSIQIKQTAHGAEADILSAVHHPGDPCIHNGAGTHGAGLQGHVQGASDEAPSAQGAAGLINGLDLRVSESVFDSLPAVASLTDDATVPHDHASYGDFAILCRFLCELQRTGHIFHVFFHRRHSFSGFAYYTQLYYIYDTIFEKKVKGNVADPLFIGGKI